MSVAAPPFQHSKRACTPVGNTRGVSKYLSLNTQTNTCEVGAWTAPVGRLCRLPEWPSGCPSPPVHITIRSGMQWKRESANRAEGSAAARRDGPGPCPPRRVLHTLAAHGARRSALLRRCHGVLSSSTVPSLTVVPCGS